MYKIDRNDTVLAVIDMQEKLANAMDDDMMETATSNTALLAAAFQLMNMPIIETLQNLDGLGSTIEDLGDDLEPKLRIEKTSFSACADGQFITFLKNNNIKNVVITGMEAHICVLMTALDLIEAGFNVHVAADAVISRNDFNWETGLDMMQKAGAVISVAETIIYQLLGDSNSKEFKDIQKLMK